MDDSLISEGTKARSRAAAQLDGDGRVANTTRVSDVPIVADENATPHRVSRTRADGEARLRDLNARAESLEHAARRLKGGSKKREDGTSKGMPEDDAQSQQSSAHLEKWRAIQTWASVDSVEASGGSLGVRRGGNVHDSTARVSQNSLPNLPETLSPITQVVGTPAHGVRLTQHGDDDSFPQIRFEFDDDDGLDNLEIDADINATASKESHPEWATPVTVANAGHTVETGTHTNNVRTSITATTDRFHSFPVPELSADGARRQSQVGTSGTMGSGTSATNPNSTTTYIELEVTRRREREARDAIDKMDRAMEKLRDERDVARESAANDRAALAASSRRETDAVEDRDRAQAQLKTLKQHLTDANEKIETLELTNQALESGHAKQLDELKRKLSDLRKLHDEETTKHQTEAEHLKRAAAALAANASEETSRSSQLEKRLAVTKYSLEKVANAAGSELEKLREEVVVLKARLSAQRLKDGEFDDMKAELAALRETVKASVSGVDGAVAQGLRRAHLALVSATSEGGPGSGADVVTSDGTTNATSSPDFVDASTATQIAQKCYSLADVLANRLDEANEKEADLNRRLESCELFEASADQLRTEIKAANKAAETAAREKDKSIAELKSYKKRAESAEQAIDAAYTETANANKKARVAEASRDAATSEANNRAAFAELELKSVWKKLKSYENFVAELQTSLKETENNLQDAKANSSELLAKLAAASSDAKTSSSTASQAAAVAEAMRVEVESARTESAELSEKLQVAETEIRELSANVETLTESLNSSEATVDALRGELQIMQVKYNETLTSLDAKTERVKEMRNSVADGVAREAELVTKIERYEQTVTSAVAETEEALRRESNALSRIADCEQALTSAEASRDDAVQRVQRLEVSHAESAERKQALAVTAELELLRRRETKTRNAFANVLSTLDGCVAGAFSKVTASPLDGLGGLMDASNDTSDDTEQLVSVSLTVPASPDFSALTPASLAPPLGCTLDHGVACVASPSSTAVRCLRDELSDASPGQPSTSGVNEELSPDVVASAAEARGAWAARQLKDRVSHLVAARDSAIARVQFMRSQMQDMKASVAETEQRCSSNDDRVKEALEVASKAKVASAKAHKKMKELSKEVLLAATHSESEMQRHRETCDALVAASQSTIDDLEARSKTLEERLDDAQSASAQAASEAFEAGAARQTAEDERDIANSKVAELETEVTKLKSNLTETQDKFEHETDRLTALALEAEAKAEESINAREGMDELVSKLRTDASTAEKKSLSLQATVKKGVATVNVLLAQRDGLKSKLLRNATTVSRASSRINAARASRRVSQRKLRLSVSKDKAMSKQLEKLTEAFNSEKASKVLVSGALAKERERLRETVKAMTDAKEARDTAVSLEKEAKENAQRSQVRLERARERAAVAAKTMESQIKSAEASAKTARSDAASAIATAKADAARARQVAEKATDLKTKFKTDLSAVHAELSETKLKLAAAEATAAAAAAAAMTARGDLESLGKQSQTVDSEAEGLRDALQKALQAKELAERKLTEDVAALERDVQSLKARHEEKTVSGAPCSPTPSVDAAIALTSIDSASDTLDADISMALSEDAETSREEELECLRVESASLRETAAQSAKAAEEAIVEKEQMETSLAEAIQATTRLTQRVTSLEHALVAAKEAITCFEDLSAPYLSDINFDDGLVTGDVSNTQRLLLSPSPLGLGGLGGGGASDAHASSPVATNLLGTSPRANSRDSSRPGSPAPELHTIHEEGSVEALKLELVALEQTLKESSLKLARAEKDRRKAFVAAEQLASEAEVAERKAEVAEQKASTAEAKAKGAEEIATQALSHAEKLENDFNSSKNSEAEVSKQITARVEELRVLQSEHEVLNERCVALEEDVVSVQLELSESNSKLSESNHKLADVSDKLNVLERAGSTLEASKSSETLKVNAKLETLEFELLENQAKMAAMETETETTAAEWSEALSAMELEKRSLVATIGDLKAKFDALTGENEALLTEKLELQDTLFPEHPVVLQLNVNSTEEIDAEMAAAAERAVFAARDDANAARDETDSLRDEVVEVSHQLTDAEHRLETDRKQLELKLETSESKLSAANAKFVELSDALETEKEKLSEQVRFTETAEASVRDSVSAVGVEMRATAYVQAELNSVRGQLHSTIEQLAKAEAARDATDASDTTDETVVKLSALREELTVRRVREAELETEIARLRHALSDTESRVFKLEAETEAVASTETVHQTTTEVLASDTNSLRLSLSEAEASVTNLRAVLLAKEFALRDVEQHALVCAEQAEAATRRAEAAERATDDVKVVEVRIVVNDESEHDTEQSDEHSDTIDALVRERTSSFSSVVESWRTACSRKQIEIETVTKALRDKTEQLEELRVSAANGSSIRKQLEETLKIYQSDVDTAVSALSHALLEEIETDGGTENDVTTRVTKKAPLGTLVEAATSRLTFLKSAAETRESETDKLIEFDKKSSLAADAALSAADARASDFEQRIEALQKALRTSERARDTASSNMLVITEALGVAKRDIAELEAETEKLRGENEKLQVAVESSRLALAQKHKLDQGGQSKLLMLQAESSELRAKVEKRNREVRELNQMLKAWEAMRHSKDQQIAQLVERCKKFEQDSAEKARAVDSLRQRVGREPGSGTPTSLTRSMGSGGLSARGDKPSSGFVSSARRSMKISPAGTVIDKENPNSPSAMTNKSCNKSVSPASASLAAFKRGSLPRADSVPGFRERLEQVTR